MLDELEGLLLTSPTFAVDNESGVEEEVFSLDRTNIMTIGLGLALLRLRFASETAVVDLQISRGEQNEIRRGLVTHALTIVHCDQYYILLIVC